METEIQNSNKWTDDTLNKLTCKELKKLARQSNINPNFKKAELVQALKSSMVLAEGLDTKLFIDSENVRRTRSRASIYPMSTTSISEPVNDIRTNVSNCENTDKPTISRNNNKKKGRKVIKDEIDPESNREILDSFKIVSSIPSIPLEEITKESKNLTIDNQKSNSNNENKKIKQSNRKPDAVLNSNDEANSNCTSSKIENSSETHVIENDNDTGLPEMKNRSESDNTICETNVTTPKIKEKKEQPDKRRRRKRKISNEINTEPDFNDGSKIECLDTSKNETPTITMTTTGKNETKKSVSKSKPPHSSLEENETSTSLEKDKNFEYASNDQEITSNSTRNGRSRSNVKEEKEFCFDEAPESTKKTIAESEMPVPVPVRGSTFILESPVSSDKEESTSNNTFDLPARSNTFTIDENVPEEHSQRRSFRFAPASQKKSSTLNQATTNNEKSIGQRILEVSKIQSTTKSNNKLNTGSSVKKTITKNITTPGSVFRNKTASGAKKIPNFKSIHQRLFSNMESLGDNQKRKLERAQGLLLSPAPRCAVALRSPRTSLPQSSSPKPLTPMNSQTSTTKTPRTVSRKPFNSVTIGNSVSKKTTPRTVSKPIKAEPTVINRFGFKTRVTRTEATAIAGKKLPPISMEKKKDQDRKFLRGVRTNKRFMLQMQMRMGQSQN